MKRGAKHRGFGAASMTEILINGNFLCRNLTGIERFAWEICKRIDSLLSSSDRVSILVPANAPKVPSYARIAVIRSDKEARSFPFWDLGVFAKTCRRRNACALSFSNTAPLGKTCGIAFIHDVYAKDFPNDFTSFYDKLIGAYSRLNYRNICKNARFVCTVSNFSKKQIIDYYRVPEKKIRVIYSGSAHMEKIRADENILKKLGLKSGEFYFTLGSLSLRKNLKWIMQHAELYPNELFVISGTMLKNVVPSELEKIKSLENIILAGYLSDEAVKALMQNCKAFVFPSYFEGFGLPPLEALSCGAPVVVSNAASLPEIYGSCAHYIDPFKPDVDLDALLAEPVSSPAPLFEKYSLDDSAKKLYALFKEV